MIMFRQSTSVGSTGTTYVTVLASTPSMYKAVV